MVTLADLEKRVIEIEKKAVSFGNQLTNIKDSVNTFVVTLADYALVFKKVNVEIRQVLEGLKDLRTGIVRTRRMVQK